MPRINRLTAAEIERRRRASVDALRSRDREAFDRLYWTQGQCCAGCDHWHSAHRLTGTCAAAGIVSGEDVLRSMGIAFSSYIPPPGFPWTKADFHCGLFRDDFDWSSLDADYLTRIGGQLASRQPA